MTGVSLEASVAYGEWEQLQRFSSSFFFAETPWTVDTTTTEIRLLSSSDSQWRWIGGVFYRESDQEGPLVFDVFGLFETKDFGTTDTQEWAVFGEMTYESTDGRWEMTAGVRYSEEDRDFTSDVTQVGLLPLHSVLSDFRGAFRDISNRQSPVQRCIQAVKRIYVVYKYRKGLSTWKSELRWPCCFCRICGDFWNGLG